MNPAYTFTPRTLEQYRHSTIYSIITINKPTQKQRRLPRHNATNSRPCDANWGGQFESAYEGGTPLELFKFCSLSSILIFRSGGPISWKSIRQDQTALISCEDEIMATNKRATEIQSLKHHASGIGIPEA